MFCTYLSDRTRVSHRRVTRRDQCAGRFSLLTSTASKMSRRAKVTLFTTVAVTIGVVYGVHWQQQREHEVLTFSLSESNLV